MLFLCFPRGVLVFIQEGTPDVLSENASVFASLVVYEFFVNLAGAACATSFVCTTIVWRNIPDLPPTSIARLHGRLFFSEF